MGKFHRAGAVLAAMAAALTGTAQARAAGCLTGAALHAAELRQLDVMLLVSSLRCRLSGVDFRTEYDGFLAGNRDELGAANRTILAELAPQLGEHGAEDALDQMSVALANRYGQDSATQPCNQLRDETAQLAGPQPPGVLLAAAERLIGADADASACAIRFATR